MFFITDLKVLNYTCYASIKPVFMTFMFIMILNHQFYPYLKIFFVKWFKFFLPHILGGLERLFFFLSFTKEVGIVQLLLSWSMLKNIVKNMYKKKQALVERSNLSCIKTFLLMSSHIFPFVSLNAISLVTLGPLASNRPLSKTRPTMFWQSDTIAV